MARARLLKPGFFKNEDLAGLPFEARLLYAGLWTLADKQGRLEDRPVRIRAELFPYETVEVDSMLDALAAAGFIVRYEIDGARYLAIPAFLKHQCPHIREAESRIPGPPNASTVHASAQHSASPSVPVSVSDPVPVPGRVSVSVPVSVPKTETVSKSVRENTLATIAKEMAKDLGAHSIAAMNDEELDDHFRHYAGNRLSKITKQEIAKAFDPVLSQRRRTA